MDVLSVTKARSKLALEHKARRDPTEAQRQLAEAKLTRYIQQIVDSAPPFTDEQVDKLVTLLRAS